MATNVQATLARLSKLNRANQGGTKMKYWKPQAGKNELYFLKTEETGDPFLEWYIHRNLLEVPFHAVNAPENYGEKSKITEVVNSLKSEDFKGNMNLWKPIEAIVEFYSPVIDLNNIEEGVQWFKYGKAVMGQLESWLQNLEEDEFPFYDEKKPERVIVTYNKDAAPNDKYKLDKKVLKNAFSEDQLAEWKKSIKPLKELMPRKHNDEEISELLHKYLQKMKEMAESVETESLDSLKDDE